MRKGQSEKKKNKIKGHEENNQKLIVINSIL